MLEDGIGIVSHTSVRGLVDDGLLLYFPYSFVQVLHILGDGTDAWE